MTIAPTAATAPPPPATPAPAWELIENQIPLRRDGDPQGLVLCCQGVRWYVAEWNSADARQADSWCRLPSWVPRQPMPPLLKYLHQQGVADLTGAKPEVIATTAIEAIFSWLQEETTNSLAYEEAYEVWVDLCFPPLADAAVDMADPEPEPAQSEPPQVEPSSNGHNGNGNGHAPATDLQIEAVVTPPVERTKSNAPGIANEGRIHRTPIPTANGKLVHYATKLTEADAKAVIAGVMLGVPQRTIAEIVGTSAANVSAISTGQSWNHVHVNAEELAEFADGLYADHARNKTSIVRGTIKEAREIRRLHHTKKVAPDAIARQLGLSQEFVNDVIARRVYRHIRY